MGFDCINFLIIAYLFTIIGFNRGNELTFSARLIKDKLVDLINRISQRECSLFIACYDRHAFFTSDAVRNCNLWSCQKVYEVLTFLLDNICIRFGSKLYRQIVGSPIGTNCVPLVADFLLFCYERGFMLSLSDDNHSEVIEAFNSTSRYLKDLSIFSIASLIAWSVIFTHQDFSLMRPMFKYRGLIF